MNRVPGEVAKDAPLLLAPWRSAGVPDFVPMYGEGSEQEVWGWLTSDPCHCSCCRNLEQGPLCLQGGGTTLSEWLWESDRYFEDLVTERLIPVNDLCFKLSTKCTGRSWAVINCLGALIQREQKLTKANFKEWKSFSGARQVIIQQKLDTSEPVKRRSQEKPFPVPRTRRAAGEVLGFVPSSSPIPVPPRIPCSGPPRLGSSKHHCLCLRASPRAAGLQDMLDVAAGIWERQPSAAEHWKSQLHAFPHKTLLISRKN